MFLRPKPFFYITSLLLIFSCSKNDFDDKNCRFLLDVGVNLTVNLNLPEYSQLQFVSNSVYIPNMGNAGIIVANIGSSFIAWDASDPNHVPSTCSALIISGLEATCGCGDENTYSLVTGQPLGSAVLQCGLKNYRLEQSGNTLFISN